MGKKKFIDKKKSATFALVFRDSSDPLINQSDRVFTRVDRGTGFVPGFTDEDPAGGARPGAWRGEREGGSDARGGGKEKEVVRSDGGGYDDEGTDEEDDDHDDSRFADAEEEEEEEEEDGQDEGAFVAGRKLKKQVGPGDGGRSTCGDGGRSTRGDGGRSASASGSGLSEERRREILEMGFPDDGYDYIKHLRRIRSGGVGTGGGVTFVPATKKPAPRLPTDVKAFDSSAVCVDGMVADEAVDVGQLSMAEMDALSTQTREIRCVGGVPPRGIDPEILAALESSGDEAEGLFDDAEEGDGLEDDFVVVANAGEERSRRSAKGMEDAVEASSLGEFAADKRRKQPIEGNESRSNKLFARSCGDGDDNNDECDAGEDHDDYEEAAQQTCPPHITSAKERPRRLLDEQFEQLTLREYADDEDELECDPEARGHADITEFPEALNEFLSTSDTSLRPYHAPPTVVSSIKGNGVQQQAGNVCQSEGSTSFAQLDSEAKAKQLSQGTEELQEQGTRSVVVEEEEEGEVESEEEMEDVYEEEDEREKWDCETIVSTYSNLDNHPARIGVSEGMKSKGSKVSAEKGSFQVMPGFIRLGGRQQLPVDFLSKREERGIPAKQGNGSEELKAEERRGASVDDSKKPGGRRAGPRGGETAEERKARKAMVKEERREARAAKKALKLMFKDEGRRAQHVGAQAIPQGIHLP